MPALKLDKICKSFGKVEVLKDIDLTVEQGEFVVFVGPSGCGKSTLLRVIAGLEDASSGQIDIAGEAVNLTPPAKRGIAMVFQSYALYPHLSVRDNMALALKQEGVPKADITRRVDEAAAMLHLSGLLDRRPAELSGGQRQRVAIGRAIVRQPKLFLFDEPLSNLDAALRVNTRIEIAALHRHLKGAMIYVTHDQTEAMTLADKIVVLRDGRVEQIGAPLELYNKPANKFVAGFLGSPGMNFFDAAVIGATGAKTAGLRPEHVRLGEGSLTATVTHIERLGGDTNVFLRLPTGEAMTVRQFGQHDHAIGEELRLGFDPAQLYLFDHADQAIG